MAAASLQSMKNFWKEFNLPELQKTLDSTATELAERQDESETSRRKLVELSRDFKKNTPEELRKKVAPLLKSFQVEIDALSKRSKASEAAFLSIYKKLVDVPDPLPALEQAQIHHQKALKIQDYEIENKKLRETLDEYNVEFAEVKNQEVTINKLKEKIKEYDEKIEERVQSKVKEREKELQKEFAGKEKQLRETQVSVARKLGIAEHKSATLQADPLPALEQAQIHHQKALKIQDYEIENKKLRETLDEYNVEFAEVKNQEVTINKLKEKIKEYDEKMEERVQSKVKEREKELQKEFAGKEKQLRETQVSVARKLGIAEHKSATLQAALDNTQTELFDVKTKYDEVTAARSSEVEILESDVDRAHQRALSAEKEVESLKEELSKAQLALQDASDHVHASPNMEAAIDAISRSTLEHELTAKERQISQLVSDVQHMQATITRLKDGNALEINRLEEQLSAKTFSIQSLEERLSQQQDYEEVKRELSVLKMIEFSSSLEEQENKESTPKSFEMLFMEKNKRLQSENTNLKVDNAELSARYQELNKQYKEAVHTVAEQKELITQLECDLLSVNALPTAYRGQGEGQAGPPSGTELVATAIQHTMAPSVESIDKSAVDSLLPIVASQRERFKLRNIELEAQTRHHQQQISVLQNEVDTLRSDNVKLYEKIKFLESYPTKGSAGRDDEAAVSRYSSQYEQRLDPFAAFNQREKQQRYMGLSPHEKVTLNMGRFLLGNKMARTISFFYLLLLHILVFLVLYKMAHTESCKRETASECAKSFAKHMQEAHNQHF